MQRSQFYNFSKKHSNGVLNPSFFLGLWLQFVLYNGDLFGRYIDERIT